MKNVVERSMILAAREVVGVEGLPEEFEERRWNASPDAAAISRNGQSMRERMRELGIRHSEKGES